MGPGDQNQSSIFDDNKPAQQVLHSVIVRALMIFLPLLALIVGVGAVVYFNQVAAQMTVIQQRELNTVDLQKKYIIADITMISSDLFYLSQMRMLGEFLETKGTISAKHITNLAEDFLHLSNSRKIYDQIRLLDENGMEIVRINFNEGNPGIVSDDKLQNKVKRYYFPETLVLDKGQIFMSPFDLNIEQGQIEKLKMSTTVSSDTGFDNIWIKAKHGEYVKPMMRFGTPVFDRQGRKRGIILLNYFGANLLRKINEFSNSRNSKSMLLNSDGYWLKGQSPEDEWGFMYKNGKELTFGKVYPKAWQQIQSRQKGQFKTSQGLFTFSTVYPLLQGQILNSGSDDAFAVSIINLYAKEYNWKIVSHIPIAILYSARNTLLVQLCAVSGLLIILCAIGSLGLAWNITKRKRGEEEREKLLKALATKNEELESIVYVSSHDLRSPLINIQGYSTELEYSCNEAAALAEDTRIPKEIAEKLSTVLYENIPESLKYIVTSAQSMDMLLTGLLTLSRLGQSALEIKSLDIKALITKVINSLQFKINESDIALTVDKLPPCLGDEIQINQVFTNLLDNAIKYLDPVRKGIIHISATVDKEMSIYCVKDNGIGIAAEHQHKVFELFHQLEPQEDISGQGLGLTIVQRIVARHNGEIWLDSEVGKGSCFYVALPHPESRADY